MRYRGNRRPALTLLEMVLTFAITMLVLLALFMVMQSQYSHLQAGRELIDEAGLARAILTRITTDIAGTLGPVDPRFLPNRILPNNANATPTNGMAAVATATAPTTGATAAAPTTASSAASATGAAPVPYNVGVKGDSRWLVLSVNRPPMALIASTKAPVYDSSIVSSDLRSLSIWLVEGRGLARNEMNAVTGDLAPTAEPNFSDPQQYVFAPEVVDIEFKYFDGTDWQTSWDGGLLGGNDGNTPIGPPRAIQIKLTMRRGPPPVPGDDASATTGTASYVHIVALPATNGFTQAASQTGSQYLIPALQAGQAIPAANQQSTTSSGM
jgi:hypothetical protein